MADLTILLISTGEAPMLRHSLPAALAQRGVEAEVVVIDNASADRTAELVAAHPPARHLRLDRRSSYAAAYNAALAAPTAGAVLFLNADCFLEPWFCAAALEGLEDERVGAVQGKLLRASGPCPADRLAEIDSVGIVVDRRHRNSIAGHGAPAGSHATPGPVFGPDGAAALYRRRMLDQLRCGDREVLDEDMALYATDADLAWRARLQGWRAVYRPQAVAYHVRSYSPTTRQVVPETNRRLQFRNRYLMMLKNETAATLLRHLPWIALFEALALGHALLREPFLLRGYLEAARLAPAARRRRRAVLERRTAGGREILPWLAGLAPGP